jgi:hypothetical protein
MCRATQSQRINSPKATQGVVRVDAPIQYGEHHESPAHYCSVSGAVIVAGNPTEERVTRLSSQPPLLPPPPQLP